MASDLEDAVDKLPWSHSPEEKGRVTKGTAYAYLGSTYMWLRRYEDAVQAFEALEGHYTLEEDFLNIHDYENKNGPESIFEIQFTNNGDLTWNRDDNNTYLQSFCMPQEINGGGYGGYPTEELYESFEPGDERRDATIIPPGGEHPDPSIDIINYANVDINTAGTVDNPWYGNDGNSGPPEGRTGYYGVKTWRNPVVEGWNGPDLFGGENQIWLRYGEVLLSLAEAYHKSGNDTEAMNNIMKVRNRAGLTSEPPGPIMDAILNEYRHEIGGEFSLWPVLRRSGDHIEYIQNTFGVTIPPGRDLLPIPRIEIDINPNLEQNDAYK